MCCGVSCHHRQGTTRASWGPPRGNGQMPAVGRGQPRRDSMGCREGLHKLLFPRGRRALGAAGTMCRVHVKVWNGGGQHVPVRSQALGTGWSMCSAPSQGLKRRWSRGETSCVAFSDSSPFRIRRATGITATSASNSLTTRSSNSRSSRGRYERKGGKPARERPAGQFVRRRKIVRMDATTPNPAVRFRSSGHGTGTAPSTGSAPLGPCRAASWTSPPAPGRRPP